MEYLILLASAALGVLLYMFLCLIYWDLFRYLPMPWGAIYTSPDEKADGKARMKVIFFIAGAIATFAMWIWIANSPETAPVGLREDLLLGFSLPLSALFLLRVAITVAFGLVSLYQRSEKVYDGVKGWVRVQLRKRGRIE